MKLPRFLQRPVKTVYLPKAWPAHLAALIEAIEAPKTWQPNPSLTPADIEQLKTVLATPVMQKMDIVMHNMAVEQMRKACFGPTADMVALMKFAAGYKASWETFKQFTALTVAPLGESENPETRAGELEHLNG